jgi:kynureninase
MITIEPLSPSNPLMTTDQILSIITQHASTTALLLLPGIQFYTGQLLDIPTITSHARSLGIFVIWDLAHAAGNVPLQLHDWDVDAAAWCSYKYLNSGPGSIAGLFVHERHSAVEDDPDGNVGVNGKKQFVNRLSGWWGSDKSSRFQMTNEFLPTSGASGWQLSNPSVFDNTSLCSSLEVFSLTTMTALREKSITLTAYLETLLQNLLTSGNGDAGFTIITPSDPKQRGAQLSLKLGEGLLEGVMKGLESRSVVVDERRPDVIRVAPAPLYNSWEDVWTFVQAFGEALREAAEERERGMEPEMVSEEAEEEEEEEE